MLMRLQSVVAMVLAVLVVSVCVVPPVAVGAATRQQTQRGGDTGHTTTVVAQPAAHEERSAPVTVLLVGLGAAVGVVVGVLPALVAAMALGYLPPPRRRERPASRVLSEPMPFTFAPVHASTPAPAPAPAPAALAVPEDAVENSSRAAPRHGQLAILAHARHQDVYDTAYADQLERVGALRSAIGDRRRTVPEPSNGPDSAPPAKGTP
jgi:hypothetical protein